jgi:uncharacterized protein Usg
MLMNRKIVGYGLTLCVLSFLIFLTPIFYQTYQFYSQNIFHYPDRTLPDPQTEVYLIGTRHTPTSSYNSDTVYRCLEKIQPDIILLELGPRFFRGDRLKRKYTFVMNFYPFLRKYWNLEMRAATKFAKYHNEVVLAGFEWEPANKNLKDVKNKSRSQMMNALLDTNTDTVKRVFEECIQLYNYSVNLPTLPAFNSPRNDALMERYVHLEYEVIPNLVLKNDSLSAHHVFARKYEDYWPVRNSHMANNILEVIRQNPDKRIVVLTGYKHRYLLHKLLKTETQAYDFRLLDYKRKDMAE